MDFYTYYLRRLENRPDQKLSLESCRDMAIRLFEEGPLTWSIASGAALLSAIHEMKLAPGVDPLPIYNEIEEALFAEIQGVRLDIQADVENKIRSTGCGRPKPRNHNRRKER